MLIPKLYMSCWKTASCCWWTHWDWE